MWGGSICDFLVFVQTPSLRRRPVVEVEVEVEVVYLCAVSYFIFFSRNTIKFVPASFCRSSWLRLKFSRV